MNYVYDIYKSGSFSKAAENLYITQPALSIAIRKLEHNLGQSLFEIGKKISKCSMISAQIKKQSASFC
ncbi:LysR family transcriptional regulator [Clostridium sp. 001]|uniref:helix-turn-helix domain-containing protein n=1 Tax=Clostridium sp. 001 TaxID=1970093 RepID=UPI0020B8342E|nr:LysR family transcriptional regulator [Clostridium sp. 001]